MSASLMSLVGDFLQILTDFVKSTQGTPCDFNVHGGYGGSSFISTSVGINIVLANFDNFTKDLATIQDDFRSTSDAALATEIAGSDDKYLSTIDEALKKQLGKVYEMEQRAKSMRYWLRVVAWIFSLTGVVFLYYGLCTGILGFILYIPFVVSRLMRKYYKLRIRMSARAEVKGALGKIEYHDKKSEVASKISDLRKQMLDEKNKKSESHKAD